MISLLSPVSRERIERWVEEQLDRLRDQVLPVGLRLGPLVRAPAATPGADWLVRVDRRGRAVPPEDDLALADLMMDVERLGLRPSLLAVASREPALSLARRPSRLARRGRGTARCDPRARRSPPI